MLKNEITKEIIVAMKSKDKLKKATLQLVKGNIENLEIEKQRDLTKAEEIKVIQKEVKQTNEALKDAEKYDRKDLVEMNESKLKILEAYLPKQLTYDEVKDELISLGITSEMNIGQAMKLGISKLNGQADNAVISNVVRELIN